MSPAAPCKPARVVGRYAIYDAIAAGGMATVHFGRLRGPAGFSRTVAVKRLRPQFAESPEFVSMFLDEARLAARIQHPNVVQTLDVAVAEGELFVVLEYVSGESLARLFRTARASGRGVPAHIAAAIAFGVIQGLHAAHEAVDAQGVPLELVHRDVSPHNVLVGVDGIARVLDFGVAKARGRAQTTQEGQLKGKLAYMAPEQLRGKVTRRTDIFAAGIVLWEALAGRALFEGDDEAATIGSIMYEPIASPRRFAPTVPAELERIVMRALERDPPRRFATAQEMAAELERSVPIATASAVGGWVEELAGEVLAQRRTRVIAIEAAEDNPTGGVESSPKARWTHGGETTDTQAGASTAPSDSGGARTAPVAGLARAPELPPTAARRARWIGAGVLLTAAVALGAFTLRGATHPKDPASATADPGPMGADSDRPMVDSAPRAPQSESDPGPTTTASGSITNARAAPPPKTRRSNGPNAGGCTPPYTVDDRGLRHYKPECL